MKVMNSLPICNKYTLSIEEASMLTGIGTKTLYRLIANNKDANFLLHVGRRTLIKREAFESYLDHVSNI